MTNLIIVGAGGFGREVCAWAEHVRAAQGTTWRVRGFLDDNPAALDGKNCPYPILGPIDAYSIGPDDFFACALGRIDLKRRCVQSLRSRGARFATIIHPSVVLGHNVDLGEGAIICPGAVITCNVRIGSFVSVNLHSTVDHDVVIGDWCQLSCHVDITGGVRLGDGVWLGSHACVWPGASVGDGAVIGAGVVVTRDVPAGVTLFSPPPRMLAP